MQSPKKTTGKVEKQKIQKAAKPKTKKQKIPADIVVISPVDPSASFVVASELADDSMIESELMGEVLPFFIYQFCEGRPACKSEQLAAGQCTHKKTTGMSVKGVNEVVRRLNRDKKSGYNIRLHPDHMRIERDVEQDGEKGVSVTVYAENMLDGNSAWGTKFEPYKKTGKNGKYANTFATEKALSKAERNAKRKLIPETAAAKMIEKMVSGGHEVGFLDAPKPQAKTITPAPQRPSTPEEVQEIIRRGIQQAKTIEVVAQIDKKTHESNNFDKEFKKEVRELASKRIDELTK